jgi:hypothetical protein
MRMAGIFSEMEGEEEKGLMKGRNESEKTKRNNEGSNFTGVYIIGVCGDDVNRPIP